MVTAHSHGQACPPRHSIEPEPNKVMESLKVSEPWKATRLRHKSQKDLCSPQSSFR